MRQAVFVYDNALSTHVLRDDHVMRPTRLRYTYELLEAYNAFDGVASRVVAPRYATEEELLGFHTSDYIEAVRRLSRGDRMSNQMRYGFSDSGDNPVYPGMFEAAALSTGASVVAAEIVASGQADVAFNVAGGLHHAMPDQASGFCIFNDPVIAIHYLLKRGLKVTYVDIDTHHGDGVQVAFYDTDTVLTISLHESGLYLFPGTGQTGEMGSGKGRGYSVNVPLYPYTNDEIYYSAFMQVVPPLVTKFNPDVLVTQLGMDTHFDDPITHLQLTVEGHGRIVKELRALNMKWVALGGGGYDISAVARGWAQDYGIMIDRDWPDEIPEEFQGKYGIDKLRDGGAPERDEGTVEEARRFAERTVAHVKASVFPLHGLQ